MSAARRVNYAIELLELIRVVPCEMFSFSRGTPFLVRVNSLNAIGIYTVPFSAIGNTTFPLVPLDLFFTPFSAIAVSFGE
jgi:hypothetical protein